MIPTAFITTLIKHIPSGNTYFPVGEKGLVTEKGLEKLISWWSHKTKTDIDVIKSYLEDGLFQFANQNAMLTITKYFAQLKEFLESLMTDDCRLVKNYDRM